MTLLIVLPDEVGATARTMFASGAIAWAHSTSRVVSTAHPPTSWSLLLKLLDGQPTGQITWKEGGSGRPKVASKNLRSFSIVGLPNASTMTIVWPRPVIPAA